MPKLKPPAFELVAGLAVAFWGAAPNAKEGFAAARGAAV